jgi:hypothetical protein
MEKNARGWIVVSRKLTESWAWQDAARLRRWLALLFAVNFADQKEEVYGETIVVHQGCSLMTKLSQDVSRKLSRNVSSDTYNDNQNVIQETQQNVSRKPSCSYELKVDGKVSSLKQYNNNKQENQLTADKSKASRQADFISWFNGKVQNARIPKIRLFTEAREKAVAQVWTQFGADSVSEVVSRAAISPFLNGEGKKRFVATFDWIFKPENFLKILEGNFDARKY